MNNSQFTTFLQDSPHLGNQFLEDSALLDYISQMLPNEILLQAKDDLIDIGHKTITEYYEYHKDAERNQPKVEQFDAWGNRVDVIHTTWGWKKLNEISARDGFVAFGYEGKYGENTRMLQFIRLYLFGASSGLANCPLAMTDGAAFLIKSLLKNDKELPEKTRNRLRKVLDHLTTRDPTTFWTSGQWMTEKRGGSDVSGSTETVAYHVKDNKYLLYGDKWFTSATDSSMCLTLARIINPNESKDDLLKKPISLFFVKLRDKTTNKLNNIQIRKLKDKLGTRQLPTAELILNGTQATLISPIGKGIKYISDMLNITRIYNAASCLSWMRRTIALVRDYSTKRKAFGQFLKDKPLYVEVLNDMEISFRGNLIFLLHVSSLLGKFELDKATSDEQHLLRMLTPILKLYSAKECLKIVSEGLECFGGQGYIESTFLPVMLRDAQVASIWEGTTNVLCLDFIKSLKSKDQLEAFGKKFRETMFKLVNSDGRFLNNNYILTAYGKLIIAYNMLYGDLDELISKKDTFARFEQHLRKICYGFAQIYIAMLLADHLIKSGLTKDCIVFTKWVELKALYKSIDPNRSGQEYRKYSRLIGLDDDDKQRFSMLIDGVEKSKLIRAKMQIIEVCGCIRAFI